MLSMRIITEDGELVSNQDFGEDMDYMTLLNEHFDLAVNTASEGHVVQVIQDDRIMAETIV